MAHSTDYLNKEAIHPLDNAKTTLEATRKLTTKFLESARPLKIPGLEGEVVILDRLANGIIPEVIRSIEIAQLHYKCDEQRSAEEMTWTKAALDRLNRNLEADRDGS